MFDQFRAKRGLGRGRAWLVFASIAGLCGPLTAAQKTELVSESIFGASANGQSFTASLSKSGRYVAFASSASDLVPGDTNGQLDVFVRDRERGTIERVSVDRNGNDANGGSGNASISGDGRFVAFESAASNLVLGDLNFTTDVFVRDRKHDFTFRVSVSSTGGEANAFSSYPAISGDGSQVTFLSNASTLVAGDTNARKDVFVRHLNFGVTRRVSVSSTGAQGNGDSGTASISWDGHYVVFVSEASNLDPFDANGVSDTFLHDLHTGRTRRVSEAGGGLVEGNAASFAGHISDDGRFVYFASAASNLVANDVNGVNDVFVSDLRTGGLTRISVSSQGVPSDADSILGNISKNGRYAIFRSSSDQLVPGDTNGTSDAFLFDRRNGKVRRVSLSFNGGQANATIWDPVLSANGRIAAFDSVASNLVRRDANGLDDVFVRRLKR